MIKKYLNWDTCIFGFILIVGFYLRVCNIGHGLPYMYDHDGQNFIEQALRYGKGTLEPFGFIHGAVFSYLLFFEYGIYFLINLFIGRMSQPLDLLKEYILNPSMFFIMARLTVVFFSMGILFLIYRICKRFFDKRVGLIAALFTSVSFYMSYLSHSAKDDIIVGFFILCAFYFAVKALKSAAFSKNLYIAALFVGIAVSFKYYSIVGFFILLSALVIKKKDKGITAFLFLKLFMKCILMISVIFLILNPYSLLDFKRFITQIIALKGVHALSYDVDTRIECLRRFILFLKEGLGAPVFYLYLASIPLNPEILLCNTYPVMLGFLLCFFKGAVPNFLVSIIPFAAISSAFLIVKTADRFIKNGNLRKVAVSFVVLIFSLNSFIVSWKYCRLLGGEDTRTTSKRWIESNIKADSSILIEGAFAFAVVLAPPLRENIDTLKRELYEIKKTGTSGFTWENKIKYYAMGTGTAYELYKTTAITQEDIIRYMPEYIIMSNYYKPAGLLQSGITKDHLKKDYVCIKKIAPDIYVNFFPCFDSLYFNTFEMMDKIDINPRNAPFVYGPAIEIYKKIEKN